MKTTDWTEQDFKRVNQALKKHFRNTNLKNHRGEIQRFGNSLKVLETVFGLPYTSSSSYPAIWMACNTQIYSNEHEGYYYHHAAINDNNEPVIVLWNEEENEIIIKL